MLSSRELALPGTSRRFLVTRLRAPGGELSVINVHFGTVSVNTVDALSAQTPFGGMKQSGFGRDLSLHSFDKYTALKTTWIKYRA